MQATVNARRPARQAYLATGVASGLAIWGFVFMRVAFGGWLLYHEAWEKLTTWTPKTLPAVFGTFAKNPHAYGFYKSFLLNVALPNAGFLRSLITGWELLFAIALILGIGLRVLIPFQIFANLNYMLAKTYGSGNANIDRLTIIILVAMFLFSAGRYYGADGFLRERFRHLAWL